MTSTRLYKAEVKVQEKYPDLKIVGSEMREAPGGKNGVQNYGYVLIECRHCQQIYGFNAGRLSSQKPRCACETGSWKGKWGYENVLKLLADHACRQRYNAEAAFDDTWYTANVKKAIDRVPLRCLNCQTERTIRITDLQQKMRSTCTTCSSGGAQASCSIQSAAPSEGAAANVGLLNHVDGCSNEVLAQSSTVEEAETNAPSATTSRVQAKTITRAEEVLPSRLPAHHAFIKVLTKPGVGGRTGMQDVMYVESQCRTCGQRCETRGSQLLHTSVVCACSNVAPWAGTSGFERFSQLVEVNKESKHCELAFDLTFWLQNVVNLKSKVPLRCVLCGTVGEVAITSIQQGNSVECQCTMKGFTTFHKFMETIFNDVDLAREVCIVKSEDTHRSLHSDLTLLLDAEKRDEELKRISCALGLSLDVVKARVIHFEVDGKKHFTGAFNGQRQESSGWNDIYKEEAILAQGDAVIRVPQMWITTTQTAEDIAAWKAYVMQALRFCLTDVGGGAIVHPDDESYCTDVSSEYVKHHSEESRAYANRAAHVRVRVGPATKVAEGICVRRAQHLQPLASEQVPATAPAAEVVEAPTKKRRTLAEAARARNEEQVDLQRAKGKHMAQVRDQAATNAAAEAGKAKYREENNPYAHITLEDIQARVATGATQTDLCYQYIVAHRKLKDYIAKLKKDCWARIPHALPAQRKIQSSETVEFIHAVRAMGFSAGQIALMCPQAVSMFAVADIINTRSPMKTTPTNDAAKAPVLFNKDTQEWLSAEHLHYLINHVPDLQRLGICLLDASVRSGGRKNLWVPFLEAFKAGTEAVSGAPVPGLRPKKTVKKESMALGGSSSAGPAAVSETALTDVAAEGIDID